jgi:hypothetical protein
MIDIFEYTDIASNNQTFFTNGSTGWQTWLKPKGASFVYITCIGGGGGGGGSSNVAGSNGGGGGGGGSSSITKLLIGADLIPDLLYINVGVGGAGGTLSGNGSAGTLSYVSIAPTTVTISNILISSGAAAAGGGNGGTSSVGGTGGSAGTVFTSANGVLSELGIWQSIAGRAGANGGYGAGGQSVTGIAGGTILSPGAGGGGLGTGGNDFAGGSILATGGVLSFNVSGGAAGGGNGRRGYISIMPNRIPISSRKFPLIITGGSGGGSNGTISGGGGLGGNGNIGCGGGGSGSIDGGSGRIGGRGGDGIVLITTF